MKQICLFTLLVFSLNCYAQNVGIGTISPNASAILDLQASNRGLLLPRTSTDSRNAIANPARGLLLFDTTAGNLFVFNGTAWTAVAGGNGWGLLGNEGTNPATNYIGTSDNVPLVFKVSGLPAGYIDVVGTRRTSFGYYSLGVNTGTGNSAFGYLALSANTSASFNAAVGYYALSANTTGGNNTALGSSALQANTTGSNNTATGESSLRTNTIGYYNTAAGSQALRSNTDGYEGTATGYEAMKLNSSGYLNSAFGSRALYSNINGLYNTALGAYASYTGGGSSNTAAGFEALRLNSNSFNTAVGFKALRNTTNSQFNVAVGYNAGISYNNSYNNVFIGANSDVSTTGLFNVVVIGQGTVGTASSQVTIGNSATTSYRAYANWTNISDGRFKKNLKEDVQGLAFIKTLRPVSYTLDATGIDEFLHRNIPARAVESPAAAKAKKQAMEEKEQARISGFVAQEVELAAKGLGFRFSGVDAPKNDNDLYGLRYAEFVVPLVKAVQEQQQLIEDQKTQLEQTTNTQKQQLALMNQSLQENQQKILALKAENDDLRRQVASIKTLQQQMLAMQEKMVALTQATAANTNIQPANKDK